MSNISEADALRIILKFVLNTPTTGAMGAIEESIRQKHPTLYGETWDNILNDPIKFVLDTGSLL